MFGSTVIEVGIGMALLFLFASLIATAAQEFLEGILQKRGKDLELGIRELLNDQAGTGCSVQIYQHPLVASLYPGEYKTRSRTLPSYIPSANFALALLDYAARGPFEGSRPDIQSSRAGLTVDACRKGVFEHIADEKVRRFVLSALDLAQGDMEKAKTTLEAAFDATMDRVSGWYKRRTQKVLLALGFGAAVFFNIDAITVAQRLARDEVLRRSVVAGAEAAVQSAALGQGSGPQATMGTLSERLADIGYPIGWKIPPGPYLLPRPAPQACKPDGLAPNGCRYEMGPAKWLMALIGWLITALAIMLGAPFWFDVLNKFMVIRSTVKPNEKSRPEASEDRQTDGKRALRVELVQKPA